jgi:hypothetical protein
VTLAAVGRAWNVDESRVRHVRDGRERLTHEGIEALPLDVRRAYHTAELAKCDMVAIRSRAPIEQQSLHAVFAAARVGETVRDAVSDGRVTEDEIVRIDRAALAAEREQRLIRMWCEEMRAASGGTR